MGNKKPKPTRYRGVLHRSRLEAKWAVFLKKHQYVSDVQYEPFVFHNTFTGWRYTPDFTIRLGNIRELHYLEIKPSQPNQDYYRELGSYQLDAPLLIAWGNFYGSQPNIRLQQLGTKRVLTLNQTFGGNYLAAYYEAKSYRFDL